MLAQDADYDLGDAFGVDLLRHPETSEPQAVAYLRERRAWKILDPSLREDFDALAAVCPGDLSIVSRSRDDATWFVRFEQDTAPVVYYAWDRGAKRALLFENVPELAKFQLAEMEPVRFTTRDGLEIHGYLSFPVGVARRGLPLVDLTHGGPWYRDAWAYNSDVQWLANRGYAVISVNFRGSTGYGKAFVNAANKEWGRKMLWDVVDGVAWAVEQGWVDDSLPRSTSWDRATW